MSSPNSSVVWIPPGAPVWVPDGVQQLGVPPPPPLPQRAEEPGTPPPASLRIASPPTPAPDWMTPPTPRAAHRERRAPHLPVRTELPDLPSFAPDSALAALKEQQKPEAKKKRRKKAEAPTPTKEMLVLAEGALEHWGFKPSEMVVAAAKPWRGSAIWRIRTPAGTMGFKLLERSPRRTLFSVGAQEYLVKRGALVPPIVPTRTGDLSAVERGKAFVMTKWIDGLVSATPDTEGAAALSYGLGEFHRLSRGYTPPEGALYASRLHKWADSYGKMRAKFEWARELANAYSEMPAANALRRVVDQFIRQMDEALDRLDRSAYYGLLARGGAHWGLVHQDYGWGNGQLGPGGVWVIDLDSVCYDLPVRDLRKLITETMAQRNAWEIDLLEQMLRAYNDAHPIHGDLFELLLIDLIAPNEFYRVVRGAASDPNRLDSVLEQELQDLLARDESKWRALRVMGLRGG